LRKGVPWWSESSYSFFFDTDCTRRVKASHPIELAGTVSGGGLTPAVILFIALPEARDNTDPG
jgi:hypothetical protein